MPLAGLLSLLLELQWLLARLMLVKLLLLLLAELLSLLLAEMLQLLLGLQLLPIWLLVLLWLLLRLLLLKLLSFSHPGLSPAFLLFLLPSVGAALVALRAQAWRIGTGEVDALVAFTRLKNSLAQAPVATHS